MIYKIGVHIKNSTHQQASHFYLIQSVFKLFVFKLIYWSFSLSTLKFCSSGVPADKGISRKDELFNKVIDWMADRGLKFFDPDKEGTYIVQVSLFVCLGFNAWFQHLSGLYPSGQST